MNGTGGVVRNLALATLVALAACGDQAEPEGDVGADSAAVAPAAPEVAPQVVVPDSMQRSAYVRSLIGRDIELQSMPVSMAMGAQFFWVDLPNGAPLLVKLDSSLVAAGQAPPSTGRVSIVGRVTAKDAALLEQWRQSGVLESDDHKMQAEFGGSYIEARRVQPAVN